MTQLTYSEYGHAAAPTVVLLHSIATSSEMWALQVPLWRQRYHVLAIDLPGHAGSPLAFGEPSLAVIADAVIAVLDSAGIARAAFVGLSFGGMVCQAIALKHPSRLWALVLANATARTTPEARTLWQQRIDAVRAAGMESQVATTLERWFTPEFRNSSPLTLALVASLIRRTDPEGFVAAGRAIQRLDLLDALPAITAPALVVSGTDDTSTAPAAGAEMAYRIRGARHALLPAAHMSALEKPIEFAELVGSFLRDAL